MQIQKYILRFEPLALHHRLHLEGLPLSPQRNSIKKVTPTQEVDIKLICLYTRGGHKVKAKAKYTSTQEGSTKQFEEHNTW